MFVLNYSFPLIIKYLSNFFFPKYAYLFVIHIDEARMHEKIGICSWAVTYEYLLPFLEVPQRVALAAIRCRVEICRNLRQ